jgi:hypothetical protein
MTVVAWVLAFVGALLAFLLAAGSAAGFVRRIDFYSALAVTPLPALAMYFSAPALYKAISAGTHPKDLLYVAGPFVIGVFTLLGTFASFRQQQSGGRPRHRS